MQLHFLTLKIKGTRCFQPYFKGVFKPINRQFPIAVYQKLPCKTCGMGIFQLIWCRAWANYPSGFIKFIEFGDLPVKKKGYPGWQKWERMTREMWVENWLIKHHIFKFHWAVRCRDLAYNGKRALSEPFTSSCKWKSWKGVSKVGRRGTCP